MGALKKGTKNFVHIIVTRLTKRQASKIKAEVRKLARTFGARVSTKRKPNF